MKENRYQKPSSKDCRDTGDICASCRKKGIEKDFFGI